MIKFILKYFILFDAIVNEIILLISFSDCLLLACRYTVDFCIFILYSKTLQNSFISSNSFLVDSLRFSTYQIMSSPNRNVSPSFFPIMVPFISFSCLIVLTKTSSTILNRSGKSRHPFIVPNCKGKSFSFSLLNMKIAVGFS